MESLSRLCRLAAAMVPLTASVVATTTASSSEREDLPVRGLVRPLNQAAIGAGIQARVKEVRFREGDAFHKGDLLIAFDCERQEAELAAADAQHREMSLALNSTSYLHQKGATGRYDMQISKVRTEKAAAELAALKANLKHCNISAPYDGRVTELHIHAHEIPSADKHIISLVDETKFEIELIVPSHWLRTIGIGVPFKFTVDELGKTYSGRLTRLGAAVDPVSQTIKIVGAFDKKPEKVLSGMSGSALFKGQGL